MRELPNAPTTRPTHCPSLPPRSAVCGRAAGDDTPNRGRPTRTGRSPTARPGTSPARWPLPPSSCRAAPSWHELHLTGLAAKRIAARKIPTPADLMHSRPCGHAWRRVGPRAAWALVRIRRRDRVWAAPAQAVAGSPSGRRWTAQAAGRRPPRRAAGGCDRRTAATTGRGSGCWEGSRTAGDSAHWPVPYANRPQPLPQVVPVGRRWAQRAGSGRTPGVDSGNAARERRVAAAENRPAVRTLRR